jgi:3-hydroxyisobutyrate dehydrogenase/2-hydroxy-3-oxopropionate reductase
MQALNESLVLAAKAGVDLELLVDILNNSVAKGMIPFKAPFILRHDFSTNFSTRWMEKDLSLVLESAGELSVPLPITSVTQQIFRATIAKGMGEDDLCGSIRVLEDLANVSVRKE